MPLLIAHRGESFDAPENTHAAFDLAWQRGDDAIEFDVHLTADNEVVVIHDADTLRTGGVKKMIREHTLAELRMIDIGQWKGKNWVGQGIPRLAEVLHGTPAGKRAFVEIKSGIETVPAMIDLVRRSPATASVASFISFNHDVIREIKRRLPDHKTYALFDASRETDRPILSPAAIAQMAHSAGADGIDVEDSPWLTAEAVREFHAARLEVVVWTIDNPIRCCELASFDVDGITTNRAAWIREQFF